MHFDVVIIGAGAAGLMCAIEAGKRGKKVLILEQANKPGKKILMSGGGRCNFTNQSIHVSNYLSHNPNFCKSALSRYTQWDFIALVKRHHIPFHEKTLGQLFCDHKSKAILEMLLQECNIANVLIRLNTNILAVNATGDHEFSVKLTNEEISTNSLVVATGGLSIPSMGASPFAYRLAAQFGLKVWPTRAGLVPLTLTETEKEKFAPLSGVSVDSLVSHAKTQFRENILFTHRGLSGPAILQISSYWERGPIHINLLPELNAFEFLKLARTHHPHKQLKTLLAEHLPKRLLETLIAASHAEEKMATVSNQVLQSIARQLNAWQITPNGTEGYRTAEVTLGGVDCDALSSKTMGVKKVPGLFFVGEAVDVTGWLGGYNFQWAWSSGWAAGQFV